MRTLRRGSTFVLLAILGLLSQFLCVVACADISSGIQASTQPTANYPLQIDDEYASPIACMKRLPDGAPVIVSQKCVTCNASGYLYIEEPDRSAGVRICTNAPYYAPSGLVSGNLVSLIGIMGTTNSGERIIYPQADIKYDSTTKVKIDSMGMSLAAIMGWPVNPKQPDGARTLGLLPIGSLVKVWGKVAARGMIDEEGLWYIYLDDGWNKLDGSSSSVRGIRVYTDKNLSNSDTFLVAQGVLTTKLYDPTPQDADGNEIVIPIIRTTSLSDVYYPTTAQPQPQQLRTISGRVRLIGDNAQPANVRIYTKTQSLKLDNVTNQWMPFTISGIPDSGGLISASAIGYLSSTHNISSGQTSVDIELQPTQCSIEMKSNKQSIATCSTDTAMISVLARDKEGKGYPNKQIHLVTTLGSFTESHSQEIMVSTNKYGFAEVHLSSSPDGAGTANITAELYPSNTSSAKTTVIFAGPTINIKSDHDYFSSAGTALISTQVLFGSAGIPNAPITYETDCGTFQESGTSSYTTYSDDSGNSQATLIVSSPETAKIVVYYTDPCLHQVINWIVIPYRTEPFFSAEITHSCPLVTDLYGDNKNEILFISSSGTLTAVDSSGQLKLDKSGFGQGNNTVSTSVLDSERSGNPCIFIPAETEQKFYALNNNGIPLAGWPAGTVYPFISVAGAVGDVNLDGSPEIIAADECCYVFSWNPTGDWKGSGTSDSSFLWRNLTGSPTTAIIGSSCALGDLNGDQQGILDTVVGTNNPPEIYAFPGDAWGDYISSPLYLNNWPKSGGNRIQSSPAIGDIDGDGKNDMAVGADDGNLYIWLSSSNVWSGYPTGGCIKSSPALADLDGDGRLDVIVGSDSGFVFAFNWNGQYIKGWESGIQLDPIGDVPVESSPVVGDVTGDGKVDVVIGCDNGNVYAIYNDGMLHKENGKPTGPIAWVQCCVTPEANTTKLSASHVITDLDKDGLVDVVTAGNNGIYVYHTKCTYVDDPSLYPWPTFHKDNQRSGCATPPPALIYASIQGIVTKNSVPVMKAKVYIYNADGSPVYQPGKPTLERGYVQTVGSNSSNEAGKGAYCINQLDPNKKYNLKVEAPDGTVKSVPDVEVSTGMLRVDIQL